MWAWHLKMETDELELAGVDFNPEWLRMKHICPCFTPSRIALAESARETVSSVAHYAFNSLF